MNRHAVFIIVIVVASLVFGVSTGLRYSQATLMFGLIALVLAPVAIHKIVSPRTALGFLVALSFYASFPPKKLFQIDGTVFDLAVTLFYCGGLWVISGGWKRSWAFK